MTLTAKEIMTIKGNAVDYAKRFLAHKYDSEYVELYVAYCSNRGVNTSRSCKIPPIDERLVKGDN